MERERERERACVCHYTFALNAPDKSRARK